MAFQPPTSLIDVPRASYGDKPAVIIPATDTSDTLTVSYASLARLVEQVARQLRVLLPVETKPDGMVVALTIPNSLEFPLAFLGIAWAGAATAPLNPDYKQDEFAFYLEDNGADLLLLGPDANPLALAAAVTLKVPTYRVDYDPKASAVTLTRLAGNGPEAVSGEGRPGALPVVANPGKQPVMYMHTSGTTSRPKRVLLTHQNLAGSLHNIQRTYELSPADRTLLVMPLFHVHGLIAGLLTTLASGGAVIVHGRFAASKFWKHVIDHEATWYTAVPTIHQILLMRAETDYPSACPPKLRFIRSCSASLAASVMQRLEDTFHAPVLEAYAMTENAHQMCSNPLPKFGPHKPGSVGKPTFIELAILDDDLNMLGVGIVGEVCIKGLTVTPGYVGNDKANEEGFRGGWFHTGDQGMLDAEGYLTLTGRIKELINRGGEKISPLEVDAVLLSNPKVAEAVSFALPDPKYGEEVAAVVVPKPGSGLTVEDVLAHCKAQLADFKLPKKLFLSDTVPRTATGKIQRRIVAQHFLNGPPAAPPASPAAPLDGYMVTAQALYAAGVRYMFGVVGIPVTRLAPCAQQVGIRFISFRNEQAAAYGASAVGYLTGHPAALLTVSGPGVVHGLAGLANAMINTWPLVMLSGSTASANVGKGGFQELDQLKATSLYVKAALRPQGGAKGIPDTVAQAVKTAKEGRPGAVYIDLPCNFLHEKVEESSVSSSLSAVPSSSLPPPPALASPSSLSSALSLLRSAARPLVVFGKGAAYSRCESELQSLIAQSGMPFLATPMGKGVLPDKHPLNAAAARSLVLKSADVVLVVGARLNWILHFGEPPRWSPDVKFILLDVVTDDSPSPSPSRLHLTGDAKATLASLNTLLATQPLSVDPKGEWVSSIRAKVEKNAASMAAKLAKVTVPLDYHTTYAVILRHLASLSPAPIVVSEGANTMDIGRSLIEIQEPRTRLDAGTWGTMGVGLGYAVAAAVTSPDRVVFAIEGDSAFGFSGMEVETMCRYKLRVIVLIFNNNGIYGGKWSSEGAFPDDPAPTAFVPDARYEKLAEAFGGLGLFVATPQELDDAIKRAIASNGPAVINIDIDPLCGVESGSLQDHN